MTKKIFAIINIHGDPNKHWEERIRKKNSAGGSVCLALKSNIIICPLAIFFFLTASMRSMSLKHHYLGTATNLTMPVLSKL